MPHRRRVWILGPAGAALLGAARVALARDDEDAVAALKAGGVVAVFRHARAPGVYDPPGMRLADCSTQRNLDDEGRRQSARLGDWFRRQGLQPAQVLASPWCRCQDTARLAFGRVESWDALGSPEGRPDGERQQQRGARMAGLAAPRPGRFDVWVTHNFVLADLAGGSVAEGEGLVLRASPGGGVQVVGRIPPP